MNGWRTYYLFKYMKVKRLIHSNRKSVVLLTVLLGHISLIFGFFDHDTSQLYHIYLYDIIVINTRTRLHLVLV